MKLHIAITSAFLALLNLAMASDASPNILLIMADDVGYECFSSYGSKEYSTPGWMPWLKKEYGLRTVTQRPCARPVGSI